MYANIDTQKEEIKMEKGKIKEIVIEIFNKYYDEEYKLLEITNNNSQQVNYIIVNNTDGIIVDFWVSSFSIFNAISNQGLLNSTYEVKTWLAFMTEVEERLREVRDNA